MQISLLVCDMISNIDMKPGLIIDIIKKNNIGQHLNVCPIHNFSFVFMLFSPQKYFVKVVKGIDSLS